jgi:hypothetical protein
MARRRFGFNPCNEGIEMYPSVVKVTASDGYRVLVEFDNAERGTLNMEPYLDFGVFCRIKDPEVFKTVRVSFDTIEWANGIDLDPKFIYEKCVKDDRATT